MGLALPHVAGAQHYTYANSTEISVPEHTPEPFHGARPSIAGGGLSEWEWVGGPAHSVGSAGQPDEQACEAITADLTGRVAVVRRGGCSTGQKATNAQTAGAIGLIVFNDIPPAAPGDTLIDWRDGSDSLVATIPVAMTRAHTGALLRALGEPTVRVTGSGGCYDYGGSLDPTPPWSYYPLAVGNTWEYGRWGMPGIDHFRERLDIVRDSVIGPRRYFVLRVARYDYSIPGPPTSISQRLLRFDTTSARVVARNAAGVEFDATLPLNALVGSTAIDGYGSTWQVRVDGPVRSYHSCYDGIADVSWYELTYRAGRGMTLDLEYPPFTVFFIAYELVHSVVNGVSWGTPWVWPVGTSEGPETSQPALRVAPLPADAEVRARFSIRSPTSLRVEVIDLLGRRLATHDLGRRPAGAGEEVLDVSGLAPGRYVVRLIGEGDLRLSAPLLIVR